MSGADERLATATALVGDSLSALAAQLTTTLTNKNTWYGGPNDLWCCPVYTYGGPNAVDKKFNGGNNPTLVLGGSNMNHAPGW